ncbi:hypothetical protein [Pampinifervens florentissimum]
MATEVYKEGEQNPIVSFKPTVRDGDLFWASFGVGMATVLSPP